MSETRIIVSVEIDGVDYTTSRRLTPAVDPALEITASMIILEAMQGPGTRWCRGCVAWPHATGDA